MQTINNLLVNYFYKSRKSKLKLLFFNIRYKRESSKQSTVRAAVLSFYEECFRWIREAISPAIQKLKKPQQDELEKLFTKIT